MSTTAEVRTALARARAAHAEQENWPQSVVDDVVAAVGWACYREDTARELAHRAVRETGFGAADALFALHRKRLLGVVRDMHGAVTAGLVEDVPELGLRRYAKPLGVVAATVPATAPCTVAATLALQLLKTRNAVVFCPNPRALGTVAALVRLVRSVLSELGLPRDVVQCLPHADRAVSEELMAGADFVVATGGAGTVRRAYSSGTPAVGAGVGNPVVIVDETADLADAATKIGAGAAYNNGTSCSSESTVLVAEDVADEFFALLRERGAHVCDVDEAKRLRELLWPVADRLDRAVVGLSAAELAARAGIALSQPDSTTVLVLPDQGADFRGPPFGEKLTPVLTATTWRSYDDAVTAVESIGAFSGSGHSCGIHTADGDRITELARRVRTSRVIVNQSTAIANTGDFGNGLPFTTVLAAGTWGGCSLSENVTWRHFLNHTWVSLPVTPSLPDEALLFGAHAAEDRFRGIAVWNEENSD